MSIPPKETPAGRPRHAVKSALLIAVAVHAPLLLGFTLFKTRSPAEPALLNCQVMVPEGPYLLSIDAPRLSEGALVAVRVSQGPAFPGAADTGPRPIIDTKALSGAKPAGGQPSRGGGNGGGASFFGVPIAGKSVVYVLDHSLSMGPSGALATARAALLASLEALPPDVRFQIIFYNQAAELLPGGRPEALLPADPETLQRALAAVRGVRAEGNTDHARALRRGLALHPDVLFLVTDADDLSPSQVRAVTRINHGQTVIHAVCVGRRPAAALAELARANRGTCFCPGKIKPRANTLLLLFSFVDKPGQRSPPRESAVK